VCEYQVLPEFKFSSSTDLTGVIPSLVCKRLEGPLPGGSLSSFLKWNKIARLIEELP
jgi:hypothetical protein